MKDLGNGGLVQEMKPQNDIARSLGEQARIEQKFPTI